MYVNVLSNYVLLWTGSQSKLKTEDLVAKETTPGVKTTQSVLKLMDVEAEPSSDQEKTTPLKQDPKKEIWKSEESTDTSADLDDVTDLCDAITPDNMDDCLEFLDQLNVRHALQDSE